MIYPLTFQESTLWADDVFARTAFSLAADWEDLWLPDSPQLWAPQPHLLSVLRPQLGGDAQSVHSALPYRWRSRRPGWRHAPNSVPVSRWAFSQEVRKAGAQVWCLKWVLDMVFETSRGKMFSSLLLFNIFFSFFLIYSHIYSLYVCYIFYLRNLPDQETWIPHLYNSLHIYISIVVVYNSL